MKLILDFEYFRKPLHTKHHEYKGGRPRPGRRFDWTVCRTEALMAPAAHMRWRRYVHVWHLWLYRRDKDGEPLGSLIAFGWVSRGWQGEGVAHD